MFTRKFLTFVSMLGLLVLLICGCQASPAEPVTEPPPLKQSMQPMLDVEMPADTYWPTEIWRTSTPEEQGMDSQILLQMLDYIDERQANIHSIIIVRHGYIVAEIYFHPFDKHTPHYINSCAASFTSALAGIAVQEGYLEGVETPVLDFFPERDIANNDRRKEEMTLEHLLTMSSGMNWPEFGYSPSSIFVLSEMFASDDWVQYVLDRPMAVDPGSLYNYNSGGAHLVMSIVRQATGMSSPDFAQEYLFKPLGISDYVWSTDPQGLLYGGGELVMRPRDMAKFGYLYLRQGVWNQQQIVPAAWVAASAEPAIQGKHGYSYGYMWWVHQDGFYHARGFRGQRIFVAPEQDIVAVFTAQVDSDALEVLPDSLMEYFILPSAKSSDPLPENLDASSKLRSHIDVLAAPEALPVSPLPEIALRISGNTYKLADNDYGWESITPVFVAGESHAVSVLTIKGKRPEFVIGLDGVYRVNDAFQTIDAGEQIALKGYWMGEDTFVMDMQSLIGYKYEVRIVFDSQGADFTLKSMLGLEIIRGEVVK
ncbi:MAG: serine hydrolase [Anaerolineae bacterium]|nr:serine hydrolase [Anaerolineae bacterium]